MAEARAVGLGGVQQPAELRMRTVGTSTATLSQPLNLQMTFETAMVKSAQRIRQAHAIRSLFEEDTTSEMSSTDVKLMEEHLGIKRSKQAMSRQGLLRHTLRSKEPRYRVQTNVVINLSG